MAKQPVAAAIELDFDGITIKAWSEATGEVHLTLDEGEELHLSPSTAIIIGMALIQLAQPED